GTWDKESYESGCEQNEYLLPLYFHSEDVIVDVGGHIGSFAKACYFRGSRRIFCFEADREYAALARENLRGLPGVKVFHRAVLDRSTRVETESYPSVVTAL